jgi:hypothetical protein
MYEQLGELDKDRVLENAAHNNVRKTNLVGNKSYITKKARSRT